MNIKDVRNYIIEQLVPVVGQREAETMTFWLIEHFTSFSRLDASLHPQETVSEAVLEELYRAVDQLREHKPIQYVLGKTVFCDLTFDLNPSVLIPRPETEELVRWVVQENPQAKYIVDLCSGSGCIAVCLAKYIPNSVVYAVDISSSAMSVLDRNARNNKTIVHAVTDDVLNPNLADEVNQQFDVIVCNPPYVRQSEKAAMHPRVLNYEPPQALFVEDNDPLLFYRAVFAFGRKRLSANGKLYVEINEAFGTEIVSLFRQYGYHSICLRKDIHEKDRMACAAIGLSK
ncbi:MAG: peptide chain release factor N(5)-glutamine methyltransferase [Bacteroidales bacterium]|jgi:release factor glutamine methyltransferase|nr:peptide chain release factor N(5)-glutamine methyltransferase [Bacteroidales bacterium]